MTERVIVNLSELCVSSTRHAPQFARRSPKPSAIRDSQSEQGLSASGMCQQDGGRFRLITTFRQGGKLGLSTAESGQDKQRIHHPAWGKRN